MPGETLYSTSRDGQKVRVDSPTERKWHFVMNNRSGVIHHIKNTLSRAS